MRIAFLSVSSQVGGSEVVLLQILRELARARAGWDLHLVAPNRGPLVQRAAALGVQVTLLPMPDSLLRLGEWAAGGAGARTAARLLGVAIDLPAYERALTDTLHAIRPDAIHSNGIKMHVAAARTRSAAPLVWHIHDYIGSRPISRALLRRYAARCAAIVANSESVTEDVRAAIHPPVAVRTIYNGIDIERFSPEGDASNLEAPGSAAPPAAGTVRVGLVGTFGRWKGHETFLRAVAALSPGTPVRAYIIGAPVYDTEGSQCTEQELRGLAASLGIADRVVFTGFAPAVDEVMRGLHIVVHASVRPEPFGLVVAEAMACGCAVVTSGTGGVAELVRDGVDALTYPPGDDKALAARIAALASDAALRARLGAAARETALARFDSRRLAEEFALVYEGASREARRRA